MRACGDRFSAAKTGIVYAQPGRVEPPVGTVGEGAARHVRSCRAAPRSSRSAAAPRWSASRSDLFGVDTVPSGSRRPCSAVRCHAAGGGSPARPVDAREVKSDGAGEKATSLRRAARGRSSARTQLSTGRLRRSQSCPDARAADGTWCRTSPCTDVDPSAADEPDDYRPLHALLAAVPRLERADPGSRYLTGGHQAPRHRVRPPFGSTTLRFSRAPERDGLGDQALWK